MKLIILFSLIFLSTCSSKGKPHHPGGTVSYTRSKIKKMTRARKNKAMSKIRLICDPGSYDIKKEARSGRQVTIHFDCK